MAEKFPYRDFTQEATVNAAHLAKVKAEEDILKVVQEHFQKMISDKSTPLPSSIQTDQEGGEENIMSVNDHILEKFFTSKVEIAQEKEQSFQEGYNKGYEIAKSEAADLIEQHKLDYEFLQKLAELTRLFVPSNEITTKYIDLIGLIIDIITKKLAFTLPVNFAEIIETQLQELMNSVYEEGGIIIKIHPTREAFTKEMLQQQSVINQIEQIKLLLDNKLGENDCILEYKETKLIYSFDSINQEIDEIIDQFKINDIKNNDTKKE